MNQQDFFIKWQGKKCNTGSVPGQCVSIVKQFFSEVLGLPPVTGNAIDYWTHLTFPKFPTPQVGDIVVFDYKPVGHIAVLNWYTDTEINCFGQNDPLNSPCNFKTYKRDSHILGYLRPKPVGPFVMNYTGVNCDSVLMESARQLMLKYTDGKIDAHFKYITHPLTSLTQDEQLNFVKGITTPFVFAFYKASSPNYYQYQTAQVIGSPIVLTAATDNNNDPKIVCYEFVNAMCAYLKLPLKEDRNDRTEDFVRAQFQELLPYVHN